MFFYCVQHPTFYDYDEGEWHVNQVTTTTKSIPSNQLQISPWMVANVNIVAKNLSILNIETILQRNYVFYNQLISVPLIGTYTFIYYVLILGQFIFWFVVQCLIPSQMAF